MPHTYRIKRIQHSQDGLCTHYWRRTPIRARQNSLKIMNASPDRYDRWRIISHIVRQTGSLILVFSQQNMACYAASGQLIKCHGCSLGVLSLRLTNELMVG